MWWKAKNADRKKGEFRISNNVFFNGNKTILFNISYLYVTSGVDNLDTNSSFSNLSASFKLLLMDKKLQFTLYGNDLLRTSMTTYSGFSNGMRNTFANYNDQRMLRISALYTFGGKLKNTAGRQVKNNDEQNRL